ncbi:MAG: RNA polymerase sigma factor [bacterium]
MEITGKTIWKTAEIAVNKTHREGGAFAPPELMDYSTQSDEQLIILVAGNDQKAFKELFKRYSKRVFNLSYSHVYDYHAAEDISQEVFLILYKKAESFKKKSSLSTWIYRITANSAVSYIRKHKKDELLTNIEFAADVAEDSPVKEEKERDEKAKKILNLLPENQKTAFILSQKENLKYREIASIMKVSEKAVESLIYRARENIRQSLKELNASESLKENL